MSGSTDTVCPHPARDGRHEWYTKGRRGHVCRACGEEVNTEVAMQGRFILRTTAENVLKYMLVPGRRDIHTDVDVTIGVPNDPAGEKSKFRKHIPVDEITVEQAWVDPNTRIVTLLCSSPFYSGFTEEGQRFPEAMIEYTQTEVAR